MATIGMLIYSTVWTAAGNKKNNINLKVSPYVDCSKNVIFK
jgi:hypothetical protein